MTRTIVCAVAALPLILVFLHSCQAQYNAFPPPQARNSIPDMITGCYSNFSAYNRFTRKPMHIDNLISIIRKIEDKTDQQWDARRIARTLVHRYMYDGMKFYGEAKPDFRYRQEPYENTKSLIVKELIPISDEEIFPDGLLDNDEKCSLHWMLSHAMNSSMREEEMFPGYNGGSGFPGSNPFNPNPNNNNGFNNNNNNGFNNNNNNNNNNGFNNNNNGYNPNSGNVPNTGGNNYYRGRRDVSEASKGNQTFDFSKATNDSMETDNASYEQDDYDVAANKTSASEPKVKSSEEEAKDGEDDDVVDVLLSDASGTGSSKSARQVSSQDNYKSKTKRPVETGVVYTKWGGIAAGRLLSGIAAGLQLTQMSVYSGVVTQMQGSVGGTNPWNSGSGTGNGNGYGNNGNNNGYGNNGNNGYGNNGNNGFGSPPAGSGSGYGSYAPSKSINSNSNNGYPYQSQPQQPQQPPAGQRWSGRKKRQVQNLQPLESLYAVTLSGDAGQAAILNAPNEIRSNGLPTGAFNDTVCPREYILDSLDQYGGDFYKASSTWTYLTEAEVRGGLDGFILGANIRRWDPSSTLRLSDILQEYYSERGISSETNFRACERSSLMNQYVDGAKLREQTRSFAYLYNNRTSVISDQKFTTNPNLFETLVNEAQQRMESAARAFNSIGPCQSGMGSDFNDNQKNTIPKLTVYGVLDHSGTIWELDEQKRFLGQLAYEINVSPTGSRLGVVDGSSGNIMISPNWTDSSSTLACRTSQIISQTRNQNFNSVFSNLKTDLERMKNEELRNNHTRPNGIVVILFVQGRRLDESQITDIVRMTRELNDEVYDVSVITTSTKYSDSDMGFDEGDYQIRHIHLPQNQGNFSDLATEFVKSLVKTTHSAFRYIQCDPELYPNERDNEHLIPTNFFLDPNTIDYYRISPDYFFRARALVLRFTSDNGKVRVCYSRKEWYPNSNNADSGNVHCEETTGNYKPIGSSEVDVQFKGGDLNKPCGKNGKRSGCDPIFISITPIEIRGPGQTGLDCSIDGCQSPSQVKVTFTHWDMRCDGVRSVLSSTVAFITLSLALLNWLKST